jgi:predicted DCC family thiol-disulfide oxidoreductase YuxK
MPDAPFLVLFDGTCKFCNGAVRFIMKRDKRGRFAFLASQTPEGRAVAARHGFTGPTPGSIVLVVGETAYSRSTASLEIARRMDGLWPALHVLIWIPGPVRDGVYNWFAARRQRFFGSDEKCVMPRPGDRT